MGHILSAQVNTEFTLPFNLKFRSALNIDDYWYRTITQYTCRTWQRTDCTLWYFYTGRRWLCQPL